MTFDIKHPHFAYAARACAAATRKFRTRRPVTDNDAHTVVEGEVVDGYSSADRYLAAVLDGNGYVKPIELVPGNPGHWGVVLVLDEGYDEGTAEHMAEWHSALLHETSRRIPLDVWS